MKNTIKLTALLLATAALAADVAAPRATGTAGEPSEHSRAGEQREHSEHSRAGERSEQHSAWDQQYGGADKSHDGQLLALREEIAPRFAALTFKDPETGGTLSYNLYTPKKMEPGRRYPLVMFIADASTAGKGVKAPLMQGYGGIIWATDEAQAQQPAFVLVPAYGTPAVNDQWETSGEVAMTRRLLKSLLAEKPIDADRVYTTGQSMGGMISFYLNSVEPDLFAASFFVGSQWDINVLKPLERAKFIYAVSVGDEKASTGMAQVGEMLQRYKIPYGETEFSARLPSGEQEAKVRELLDRGLPINFIRFTANTVMPEGSAGKGAEHMYSFDRAYLLAPARSWLLQQRRGQ